MSSSLFPQTVQAHVFAWGVVCALAVCLNYGALALWFLRLDTQERELVTLKPTLDVVPPLVVGAVLTFALLLHGASSLLFGMWMCLYGLAQVAYRQSLPRKMYAVGLGYIVCGAWCLLPGTITFTNPWPMGIVFFVGELASGIILITHKTPTGKQAS